MRTKNLVKKIMSGVLCTVMTLSVTAAPMPVWAQEPGNDRDVGEYAASLPELEDVKDQLDKDEIVSFEDIEVDFDAEIDLSNDFTGITIPDKKKVKVSFYKAGNADRKDFSTSRPGTYKASYFAEPADATHPAYRFSRKITVKEARKEIASTAAENSENSGNAGSRSETETHKNEAASEEDEDADSETDKGAASTAVSSNRSASAPAEILTEGPSDQKSVSTPRKDSAEPKAEEGSTSEKGSEAKDGFAVSTDHVETAAADTPAAGDPAPEGSSAGKTAANEQTGKTESTPIADTASTKGSGKTTASRETAGTGSTETAAAPASASAEASTAEPALSATGDTNQPSGEAGMDDPYGDDSGWTTSGIIRWATEQEEISLAEMGVGETVTFEVPSKRGLKAASTGTMTVEITKGERYHYYDYGLGTFWTHPYYVKYGNITATAYCIEPSKSAPDSGTYTITKLKDSKTLAKVCYYGNKYSGDEGFFAERYPDFPAPERFIITHLAAGYANEGEDAFRGTYDKGRNLALEMYNYCQSMPDIPDVDMEFSDDSVAAYVEGSTQRTKEITFKADVLQTVTFKLPSGVKLHNVSTGKTSAAGANVEIPGGTKFYFSAPLTQAQDTGLTWHSKMTGSVTKDYSAYTVKGGSDEEQDLALVFGEAVGDEKYVEMDVTWVQGSTLTITKTNAAGTKNLAGAVYGVYSDKDCKNLIVKMPATNSSGTSTVELNATGTVYLKELTAPEGFKLSTEVISVTLTAGKTTPKTIKDEEILGTIKVTKEGQVLTGADTNSNGTKFSYEKAKLANATFSVTAAEEIRSADGTVAYKKGAAVGTLKTNSSGEASISGLPMGAYTVTETGAPANFVNKGESKSVTLKAGSTSADVTVTASFTDDRQKVEVTAVKEDKLTKTLLSGAVFGMYAGADIKNNEGTVIVAKDTLIGKVTTGSDGKGTFAADLPLGRKFYVKELTAPAGYKLNGSDTYSFTTTYTNDQQAAITFTHTFTNEEIRGKLTIYKEGEVLVGADVTDAGTTFKYETKKQKYATFAVYAGADIVSAGGKKIYKKGDLVKDGLVTGTDGSVTLDNLYLGTYTVKETAAPENFVLNGESRDITLSLASLSGEVVLGEVTIRNERQKAKVTVTKQDDTTKNPLSGGIYGIYAGANIMSYDGKIVANKDTFIEKVTTGSDGTAVFKSDLPLNNSYYVKEIQAPENYYRNQKDSYSFTFRYTNEKEAVVSFAHTFENERVNARIDLTKVDKETGAPQGDAKFFKATYGLFARENIVHPDGKTGVLYKAGAQVATLTTDAGGKAFIEDLYLGKYYIKELIPSEGYLLDEAEYDIDCAYEGDLVKTVKKTCTSKEQVIKQPFQVIKAANSGQTDADLLQGVGFSAYLISSLKTNADGSYDLAGAQPVVLTSDGKTEMFTDKKGHAVSIPIPYGKYIVRETTTPHNFNPVDDFKVTITENLPAAPQQWRVLLDDEFEAKLKIIKKDDETKKSVLLSGTEFKVFDVGANAYVEQVTTYPSVTTHTSYFTDENGWLILPDNLKPGHYRIEEVMAPFGYVLSSDSYEVDVDTNTAYQMDKTSGDAIIEVEVENQPVKGKLIITKAGEVLTSFDTDFHYEERNLAGAEFVVYAEEDIFTPDYQKDGEGNRIRIYEKDSLVTTVTTGEDGTAVIEDLPLGTYRVEETKAPEGFILNAEPQEVTFTYLNQQTPVIEHSVEFTNDRQRVEISVEKQDSETGAKVEGAVFGLYAAENINTAEGTMLADAGIPLVEKDTLLAEAVSGKEGTAVFEMDLPLGQYYVKELKAPDGYVSSDEVLTFDASYQGQDTPAVRLTAVKKNEPIKVEFTKSDITSAEEIDGAVLTILTRSGEEVERWTTVKGEPYMVRCLTAGESYILREETAPYGYLRAEDVVFTVEDTGEIQKVEMQDKVPTALLIIDKKGEFLDQVSFADTAKGTVERIFEYISGTMTSVTFEVYAAEDIKAADGVAEDFFKKDQLVGTITTDDTGIAKLGDLPVGRYYVVEKETAHGYVLDCEPRYVDLSYRDQYTPIVVYDEKWQNVRQKVSINLRKTDSETGNSLKGASFGLYAAEDILSASGDVLIKKDELIEMRATNENGEISFTADLPVDAKYFIQEVSAPRGYTTNREAKEFTFEYEGPEKETISFDFEFVNEPTKVEISKTAITGGPEIPGARLQVLDMTGNVVDEWVSEKEPHLIKHLHANREYELVERKPADGYTTAESIVFTVKDTMEVQKVQMKDDVTKVRISKTDITTCEEIPGAKLTIFDEKGKKVKTWTSGKEPYYIEKLPVGSYTLREELAPDGYLRAEDVKFTVKDTGIEQKVEMKDKYTKVQVSKQNMTTSKEIPGAHLTLFDKNCKVIEKWVSTKEPHMIERLPAGEYKLREELAPDGYVRAEDVTFTVKETGEIQKVFMKDDYTKVHVSKQDMTTSKEIPGAHLTLFDKDGKVIEKWVSGDKPHYISMLKPGEYMLREELAPDGYLRAEDVKFTVEETGDIQKVYMKDAYTKVQISKTDMVTKEEIPGAKLYIFDKNGETVAKWTSGKEPHMIERLKPGTYTLREELAPDGYIRAEDVKFTVKETGEIQKVAMVDDYTKVQISKTDLVTKRELPGAKLKIFDKDGKTIESWTSGKEPHMIEKLKPGTYTLREVTAPNGYEVAEDVKFTVKETGEIQKVSMVDAPKESKKSSGGGGSSSTGSRSGSGTSTTRRNYVNPQTGDTTNVIFWIILLLLGGIMFGAFWYAKKEMEKKNSD